MTSLVLKRKRSFQQRLLSWYQKEKRPLPWRTTRDPYKIWVSEIMLQQTQVATVIPYYEKWLKTFPTVHALAQAPIAKVLKLWEGLGYYRRARMLHQAAQIITKTLDGKIPGSVEELRKLPGIGRYSAGAIASIAFEVKAPVLDGNVIRVLTRVGAIAKDIDRSDTIKSLWDLATLLLPEHSLGDFNQALMELGATVCFPQNPDCGKCPLMTLCLAHTQKREIFFPVRVRQEKYENLTMYALALQNERGEVFLQKQSPGHWWAGLWAFPFWDTQKQFLLTAGDIKKLKLLGTMVHSVTRFRIKLCVYRKTIEGSCQNKIQGQGRWMKIKHLKKVALPVPHRKITDFLS